MKPLLALLAFVSAALLCASAQADVQQSECLPHLTRETAKWPVRAIYLHGLFKGPGSPDQFGWRKLEAENRRKLERIARRLKIRIAVPVAPVGGRTRVRQWNMTDLPKIELSAARACGVRKIPAKRALIGFSNGGYRARKIGLQPCSKIEDYEMILAIGAPSNTRGSSCMSHGRRKLTNFTDHNFSERFLADKLESLSALPRNKGDDLPETPPLPPENPTSGSSTVR